MICFFRLEQVLVSGLTGPPGLPAHRPVTLENSSEPGSVREAGTVRALRGRVRAVMSRLVLTQGPLWVGIILH